MRFRLIAQNFHINNSFVAIWYTLLIRLLTGQCPKVFENFGNRKKVEKWQFLGEFSRISGYKGPQFVNSVTFGHSPVNELIINTSLNSENSQIFTQVNADTSYLIYSHISFSILEPNLALSQLMTQLVHVIFVVCKYFSLLRVQLIVA